MAMLTWSRTAKESQVAALCYRRSNESVEFLLVHTSHHDKWTFPKGRLEPALTPSRAAEKEAWEEAGVRGVIQPRPFDTYLHLKRVLGGPWRNRELTVEAFLLAVESLHPPPESGRNPTWFSAAGARQVLARGREPKYAREIQRVLDRAVAAIEEFKPLASMG